MSERRKQLERFTGKWKVCPDSNAFDMSNDEHHDLFEPNQALEIIARSGSLDSLYLSASNVSQVTKAFTLVNGSLQGVCRINGHLHRIVVKAVRPNLCKRRTEGRCLELYAKHQDSDESGLHEGTYHTHEDD